MNAPGPALAHLPAPLDRWAAELLGALPAAEQTADCAHCVMCRPAPAAGAVPVADAPQRIVFDPVARCCTYQPFLPNHLVGAALADPRPELAAGQATLRQRMARGHATPLGLRVDPAYQIVYRQANEPAFGRARSLRCPHHQDDGGCGLWDHRPAVCATWFCKHDRAQVGQRQWRALNRVLQAAERVVALLALRRLGLPPDVCQGALDLLDQGPTLNADALDQRPDPALQALWGPWWGREEAFYIACHGQVQALTWAEVQAEGGAEIALLAQAARDAARAAASDALPPRVRLGQFRVCGQADGRVWLQGHSDFDPLAVGVDAMALLARCDGRHWDEIADEHAALHGQRPSRWLLRALLDHGLLLPA